MILDTSSSIDNPTLANVNRFKSGQKYPKNIRLPNFESKSLERY